MTISEDVSRYSHSESSSSSSNTITMSDDTSQALIDVLSDEIETLVIKNKMLEERNKTLHDMLLCPWPSDDCTRNILKYL